MDLSIVIISYNTKDVLKNCIDSIAKHVKNLNFELIVVDNASHDGSSEYLEKEAARGRIKIKLIKNKENVGFAAANNQGIDASSGEYILFLNSDTLFKSNFLKETISWMEGEGVGVAGVALKNPDGSLQENGGYFPGLMQVVSWMIFQDFLITDWIVKPFHPLRGNSFLKNYSFYKKERELDWLTGAFILVKRFVIDSGVRWCEDYFMYTEDVDFCFQAKRAGFRVVYNPRWSIIHFGGASGTRERTVISEFAGIKIFYKRNYSKLKYPFLILFLKIGALGRAILFFLLGRRELSSIYAKAFKKI